MTDLLTPELYAQLLENGAGRTAGREVDLAPVVKLFMPDGPATWLLTELDPADPDLAFGLCDMGVGYPEIGSVRLSDISALSGALGLAVQRDVAFRPVRTLTEYARLAAAEGRIRM